MLRLSNKKIFSYHLKFIIPIAISFSIIVLALSIQSLPQRAPPFSPSTEEELTYDRLSGSNSVIPNFLGLFGFLLLIIGLLILFECFFFWIPSLTDFVSIDKKGEMVWRKNRFWFPERWLNLKLENASISLHRKRFSLNGLLMREFIAKIHLPRDTPELKRLSDFIGVEKIVQTPTHFTLIKSIGLRYLPLQIIQVQSLLAVIRNRAIYQFPEETKN
ncbi:MAG: hypothetical protein ACFE95_14460 [Candidatus Hodarchaeota archaeon]